METPGLSGRLLVCAQTLEMLEHLLEVHQARIERLRRRIARAEQGLTAVQAHLFQHLQRLDTLSALMRQRSRRRDVR